MAQARAALAAAVALVAGTASFAPQARADFAESLIGSTIGTIIGQEIHRNVVRPQERTVVRERVYVTPRTTVVRPAPSVDPWTRSQNRELQVALNYFGFDAGSPDGIVGRRTRSAISTYQASVGFPVTGYVTEEQRVFLVGSYNRAMADPVRVSQIVADRRMGMAGVLAAWNEERLGVARPAPSDARSAAASERAPGTAAAVEEDEPAAAPEAPTEVAAAEPPARPGLRLLGTAPAQRSITGFCAQTGMRSAANGGLLPVASLAESEFALGEQFCLGHAESVADADALLQAMPGATLEEVTATCESFVPEFAGFVNQMATRPAEAVIDGLHDWSASAGMDVQTLAQTARICLGFGYNQDNAAVAISAALALVAAGEDGYGELLAAHLAMGFGATENRARAATWYDAAATAIDAGMSPVVMVDGMDRAAFLRTAAMRLRGEEIGAVEPAAPETVPAAAEDTSPLPSFAKKPASK